MSYLGSDEYDDGFYGDALLCGSYWNAESNETIDEYGAFPETTSAFFNFSSGDASDQNKSGELDAA